MRINRRLLNIIFLTGFLFTLSSISSIPATRGNILLNESVSESASYDWFGYSVTSSGSTWVKLDVDDGDNQIDLLLFNSVGGLLVANSSVKNPKNVTWTSSIGTYYLLAIWDGYLSDDNSDYYDISGEYTLASSSGPFGYSDKSNTISSSTTEYLYVDPDTAGTARILLLWDETDYDLDLNVNDELGNVKGSDSSTLPWCYIEATVSVGVYLSIGIKNLDSYSNSYDLFCNYEILTTMPYRGIPFATQMMTYIIIGVVIVSVAAGGYYAYTQYQKTKKKARSKEFESLKEITESSYIVADDAAIISDFLGEEIVLDEEESIDEVIDSEIESIARVFLSGK